MMSMSLSRHKETAQEARRRVAVAVDQSYLGIKMILQQKLQEAVDCCPRSVTIDFNVMNFLGLPGETLAFKSAVAVAIAEQLRRAIREPKEDDKDRKKKVDLSTVKVKKDGYEAEYRAAARDATRTYDRDVVVITLS